MRPIFVVTLLLVGCATAGTSLARPTAPDRTVPLSPELFLSLSVVKQARISPDGRWIAYELSIPQPPQVAPSQPKNAASSPAAGGRGDDASAPMPEKYQPRSEIWLVSTSGGAPRRVTDPTENSWSPRWSPDGKRVAFLSRRTSTKKLDQLFVIPIAGGKAAMLTSMGSKVKFFEWSPDGKFIAFTAASPPDQRDQIDREAGRDWNIADHHRSFDRLWMLDMTSGQIAPVVGDLHVQSATFARSGDQLLISASTKPDADSDLMRRELYRVDRSTGQRVQLTRRAPAKLRHMAWSPGGSQIAFSAGVDKTDPTAGSIFVMSADGSGVRNLTGEYRGTVSWLDWTDDETLLFAAVEGPHTVLRRLDVKSGRLRHAHRTGRRAGAIRPMCYQPHLAADRTTYACAADSTLHPGEVYTGRIEPAGPDWPTTRLTISNPALERVRFAPQEVLVWKTVDGLDIDGILIKPLDYRPQTRYPLVVLPHGGPEGSRENGWLAYPGQLLAARGFVVLYPNYRGSSGRGVSFAKGDHRDLGGKEFDDILAGIDHLDRQKLIDPARVGIGGWSYGGYLSAWAGTRHSGRFAAAVMGAGISNWISYQGVTDIPEEMSLVHWALDPYEEIELVWDRSPLAHAATARTPMLIIHGENDPRVPVGQAWEMYRALAHRGVETKLITYPREKHSIREYAHYADMVMRFLGWFDRHLVTQ